jgi:D-aminopeptidase
MLCVATASSRPREEPTTRARDLGITLGTGAPGPHNSITDVEGVRVGHETLIAGDGPLVVGRGPVRTGVTVIVPSPGVGDDLVFAGTHRLNGNGELTGLEWIRESGMLTTPIAITNTHSVGVVRDALIAADVRRRAPGESWWSLPVVGETWDGVLSDVSGMHVRPEHVFGALESAAGGPVAEGNVGGGTGMICHGFKGGIGTASRVLPPEQGGWVVAVLVQANHGSRARLTVNGVPVGRAFSHEAVPVPWRALEELQSSTPTGRGASLAGDEAGGSIIAVAATDAPLIPTQCRRLAQRIGLGIARTGGAGENSSGDLFLAFSTANRDAYADPHPTGRSVRIEMLSAEHMSALFHAVIEATEEAILNALLQAETMTGRDGITAHALDPGRLVELLQEREAMDGGATPGG